MLPSLVSPNHPGYPAGATDSWGEVRKQRLGVILLIVAALLWAVAVAPGQAPRPEGTLTVAVATFGNERWLPHLYVGAEDVVLKPLWENLLSRDGKGNLIPVLAERWQVSDGGRTWKFHL